MNQVLESRAKEHVAAATASRPVTTSMAPLAAAAKRAEEIAQEEIHRVEREREAERVRFQLD